ncbi:MAG: dihydrofolate reductase family protein [Stackebrandtia sp.]
MRKLVYYIASTLDGFIAGPDRSNPTGLEDGFFAVEGDHMTALLAEYPETVPGHVREPLGITAQNRRFDTVLEGRRSYEVGLAEGVANAYPHMRHYVFSRTMTATADPAVELVSGDPAAKIRELKRQDGLDIWLCGGGSLAETLRDEIDELHVKLYPVVVGSGTPLFDGEFRPRHLVLEESRAFDSGVVWLRYTTK